MRSAAAGFVLIPALAAIALFALVALLLTRSVALDIKVAANLQRDARLEELADGLARLASYTLAVSPQLPASRGPFKLDGTPLACRVADFPATVSVTDTAGQIDLNFAPREVLERTLTAVGLSQDAAQRLAAAIVDFRDDDDVPVPGGAERSEYRQAGLGSGPKNGPFTSVGELDQVLGMTPQILARLRPLVTVYAGNQPTDVNAASAKVLQILQTPNVQSRLLARIFTVRTVVGHGRNSAIRETTIEMAPRTPLGFLVRDWSRLDREYASLDSADMAAWPPCLEALRPAKL